MKSIFNCILSLGFVATATCMSYQLGTLEEFQAFKLQYGKVYENSVEESLRMKIFMENKLRIASHNKLYDSGLKTYKLNINQFSDMLPSEFSSTRKGLKGFTKKEFRNLKAASFIEPDDDVVLPKSMDWQEMGAVTPVKYQGSCGSCYAFSATGGLEGQHFRKTGQLVSLSEQNVVDCSKSFGNEGCGGGLVEFSFDYIKNNHGIDTEESYPYEGIPLLPCRYNPANSGAVELGYVQVKNGSESALKKAVALIGPISVAIDASSDDFFFYSEGIFEDDQCYKDVDHLDHAVLVVGYGTENGKDYWLVKNSWSTDWGIEGYIKMARNQDNMCGIATDAIYPLV